MPVESMKVTCDRSTTSGAERGARRPRLEIGNRRDVELAGHQAQDGGAPLVDVDGERLQASQIPVLRKNA
jgi:hypothetical protein